MAFNLYPDVLLDLKTFPTEAYAMQSSFYPTVRMPGGVPLDDLGGLGQDGLDDVHGGHRYGTWSQQHECARHVH